MDTFNPFNDNNYYVNGAANGTFSSNCQSISNILLIEEVGEKRIHKTVKLINARDPPNKVFESSVNLTNQDAWKRRSIYMSKAQFQFDTQPNDFMRFSVNTPIDSSLLKREDSNDDNLWNNVDEGISVYDRIIPVIGTPK